MATSLNVLVPEGISLPCLQDVCLNLSLQEAATKDTHFDLQRVLGVAYVDSEFQNAGLSFICMWRKLLSLN